MSDPKLSKERREAVRRTEVARVESYKGWPPDRDGMDRAAEAETILALLDAYERPACNDASTHTYCADNAKCKP